MTNSRTKGHSYERTIANEWREMGYDALTKRAARGGDWSTTDDGIDIVGTEGFKVQCKRYNNYVPVNKIEEVVCNRDKGDVPLLITKGNRKEAVACLYWNDLKSLISQAKCTCKCQQDNI